MTEFAISADGARIVYDRLGSGAIAVILVAEPSEARQADPETLALGRLLADRGFSVIHYERRGGGADSAAATVANPGDIEQERQDLATLLEVVGEAALFGSAASAAQCLSAAAASGTAHRVSRVALWRSGGHDSDQDAGGDDRWVDVAQPVLMIEVGGDAPETDESASAALAAPPRDDALLSARSVTIDGADGGWRPEVMAGVLGGFLTEHEELAVFPEYPDDPQQEV